MQAHSKIQQPALARRSFLVAGMALAVAVAVGGCSAIAERLVPESDASIYRSKLTTVEPLGDASVPWLKLDGMTAERSSATTGAQTLTATFRVFRWSGASWAYETGNTVATTIPTRDEPRRRTGAGASTRPG